MHTRVALRDREALLSCHAGQVPRPRAHQASAVGWPRTVIALVILVFVDAHDAATPLPGALARAAEEALGSDVSVSIRTLASDVAPPGLVEPGRAEHATAVARITWTDEQRSEARLDVLSTDGGPARTSTIAFGASDPLAERGRAIGLVLAALLAPENQAHLERERRRAPTSPPAATVASAPPPPPPPPRHFALDAAAAGGFALGGAGSGVGGTLGLRWHPGSRIGLRIGVQAPLRRGQRRARPRRPTSAARRAWSCLRHPARGGTTVRPRAARRRAPALRIAVPPVAGRRRGGPGRAPAARAPPRCVEGQLAVSPTLALFLARRSEIAFGRTDVFVHQEKVAEFAPLRLVVDGGPGGAILTPRIRPAPAPVAVL